MNGGVISAGDTAWVLVSAALVLLMVPGLALFYGGLVRSKSSLNTMMMSAAALGIVGVQWLLFGYSLSFEPGGHWLGGLGWVGFRFPVMDAEPAYAATIPHAAFALFQAMFAVITAALISGALVERMSFRSYLAFIVLWTTLIYDPLAHAVWGVGGWLRELGALDFAGGTVVHISAGTSALVAALVLGPRREFRKVVFVPHNVPFTLLGAGLLWFGWFGFNAGSALAANGVAALAFTNTFAGGASGLAAWIGLELLRTRRSTAVGAATGTVVGLVAVTPAAGYVSPLSALAIGLFAACASHLAMELRARVRVDDSLDVFACHGVAGISGALLTGVFASTAVNPAGADGLLAGNVAQVGVQLVAIGVTVLLSGVGTLAVLKLVGLFAQVRVPLASEVGGLDISEHGEEAYYGGDVGALVGRRQSLGDSVLLPASEVRASFQPQPQS